MTSVIVDKNICYAVSLVTMGGQKKILFVVGPALGHVGRSLVIARALFKRNVIKIHFACVSPGNGEKTIGSEFECSCIGYKEKGGQTFATNLENIIARESPDLICLDLTPVPWLYQVIFPPIPQVYITNFFLTKLGQVTTMQDQWFGKNSKICNMKRVSRGLQPIIDARELYERDLVLLSDPFPLLDSLGELPNSYCPTGPCVWEPRSTDNSNLNKVQDILFVSMGSSGHREIALDLIEALTDIIKVREVVWVGQRNISVNNRSTSFSCQYFDQLAASAVIPKARLVITQGGAGSTYQALSYGVPVLIYPTHENHRILGQYIEKTGFGLLMTDGFHEYDNRLLSKIDQIRQNIMNAVHGFSLIAAPNRASQAILECIDGS